MATEPKDPKPYAPQMNYSMITVKIHLLGELKRFTVLKTAISFKLLTERVQGNFGPHIVEAMHNSALRLKYEDPEGDSATLENEVNKNTCVSDVHAQLCVG